MQDTGKRLCCGFAASGLHTLVNGTVRMPGGGIPLPIHFQDTAA